ncbi:hypothetical protein BMS3Bbin10_02844 [bacterium BMS3Bbin10]|nr:hypothetical protein BMS3Bbin10_02844 [bacterium BMS3Bbin10]
MRSVGPIVAPENIGAFIIVPTPVPISVPISVSVPVRGAVLFARIRGAVLFARIRTAVLFAWIRGAVLFGWIRGALNSSIALRLASGHIPACLHVIRPEKQRGKDNRKYDGKVTQLHERLHLGEKQTQSQTE